MERRVCGIGCGRTGRKNGARRPAAALVGLFFGLLFGELPRASGLDLRRIMQLVSCAGLADASAGGPYIRRN
jgi:hypothetical protein